MSEWKKVVMACECPACEMCGEPVCLVCQDHYADCECPGPHQDDEYEYHILNGVLYAKRLDSYNQEE